MLVSEHFVAPLWLSLEGKSERWPKSRVHALVVEVDERLVRFTQAFLEDAALVLRLLEQNLHLLDLSLVHHLDARGLLSHVILQVGDLLLETLVLQLVEAALRATTHLARERAQ